MTKDKRLWRPRGTASVRDSDGNKECYSCQQWLPERDFSRSKSAPDGLAGSCRVCTSWRARDRRYGLNSGAASTMWLLQGARCAICRTEDEGSTGWQVDHDHTCCQVPPFCGGCVRGVLCGPCNRGLAAFRDSGDALISAARYLKRWGESRGA